MMLSGEFDVMSRRFCTIRQRNLLGIWSRVGPGVPFRRTNAFELFGFLEWLSRAVDDAHVRTKTWAVWPGPKRFAGVDYPSSP